MDGNVGQLVQAEISQQLFMNWINLSYFDNPLTFLLVPPSGQIFSLVYNEIPAKIPTTICLGCTFCLVLISKYWHTNMLIYYGELCKY